MNETINTITILRVYPCWSEAGAFHVEYTVNDGSFRTKCMDEVDNAYHAVNRLINQVCENAGTSRGQVSIERAEGYDNEVKSVPAVNETMNIEVAAPVVFDVNTVEEPTESTLYITEIRPLTEADGYEYTHFRHSDGLLVVFKEIDITSEGAKRYDRDMKAFEEGAVNEQHALDLFTKRWTQDWSKFAVVDVRTPEKVEHARKLAEMLRTLAELVRSFCDKREQEVREELQLVGRFGTVISINGTETESNLLYKDVVTALRNAELLFANNSGASATGFSVDYVNVIDIEAQFDRVVATVKADGRFPNGQYTYFNHYYVTVDDTNERDQFASTLLDTLDSFGIDDYRDAYDAYYEDFDDLEDVPF